MHSSHPATPFFSLSQHTVKLMRTGLPVLMAATMFGVTQPAPARAAAPAAPLVWAPLAIPIDLCFAEMNGDNITDYSSANANAVQQAVDAVAANGTVKVAGVCAGVQFRSSNYQTVYISNTLTLEGGYTNTNWLAASDPIANPTTLDAQAGGRVIRATVAVTLSNLTVQNGQLSGSTGAGARFQAPAVITGVTFYSNTHLAGGGGGATFEATATITSSTFISNNVSDQGGGALFYSATQIDSSRFISNTSGGTGAGAYFSGAAEITGTAFLSNTATPSEFSSAGGAYFADTTALTNTTFSFNSVTGQAGGAWFTGISSLMNTTFISNTANSHGGGAVFYNGSTWSNNTFERNQSGGNGGGVYSNAPITATVASTFISNTALNYGGGATFSAGATLGALTFSDNRANNGGGASFSASATLSGTSFISNSAIAEGGGAYFSGAFPKRLVNVLFARNTVGSGNGTAIFVNNASSLDVIHATIVSPTLLNKSAIYVQAGAVNITNTLIASHTPGIVRTGGTVKENYNLFSGVTTPYSGIITSGGNSITGTAAFFDTTTYTLTASSAAVDAGTNAGITSDFFGNPRPQGNGFDIGYNESPFAATPAACYATADNGATVFSSANANAVQQAVDAASAGGTVKLAGYCAGVQTRAGTTQTVVITKSLTLMGGFTNTVGGWTTAFPITQTTTLDAQAGGRVISATAAVTISIVTIQNGRIASPNHGGGAYFGSAAMVTSTTFISNSAGFDGGGAYFLGVATIISTTFSRNATDQDQGAGAYFNSTAVLTGATFISNTADQDGGGAYFRLAVSLSGTSFISNVAGYGGGAWFNSTSSLTSTTFTGNTANGNNGGGAYFQGTATLTGTSFISNYAGLSGGGALFITAAYVTNTTFVRNRAFSAGGGAQFGNTNFTTLVGTTFISNTAGGNGGGANFLGTATMTGTAFTGNSAIDSGGGVYLVRSSVPSRIVNSLFDRNTANTGSGHAIYFFDPAQIGGTANLIHTTITSPTVTGGRAIVVLTGTVNITNTLIASYTIGIERTGGTVRQNYNLFSGVTTPYSGTIISGGNSITGTAGFFNTTAYTLTASSAAIDAGTNAGVTTDFFNTVRPQGFGFDIGYNEYIPPPVCFAEYTGDNTTDFSSVNATAVQQAVDAAAVNGTVKVAGTCAGVQTRAGTTQTVIITKALTLLGGYTNTNWLAASDPTANPTVLNALTNGRVISTSQPVTISNLTAQNGRFSGNGAGAYFASPAVLSGVAFRNNTAFGDDPLTAFGYDGGGAYFSSTAVINGVTFFNNGATGFYSKGGGAAFNNAAALTSTTFTSNTAESSGGAYFNAGAVLTSTDFISNSAGFLGGGGATFNSTAMLTNTTFTSNTTTAGGGGAQFQGAATVAGAAFTSNTAGVTGGGGAYFINTATLTSTTFTSNTASIAGGAMFEGVSTVAGSDFISNTATTNSGGGAYFYTTTLLIGSDFTSNSAIGVGGGAAFQGPATLTGITFTGNTASYSGGGAQFGAIDSIAILTNTIFTRNSADYGGGAYFYNATVLTGTTFTSNTATSDGGGALFYHGADVTNTAFIANTANQGGGAYFEDNPAPRSLVNVLFARNRASNGDGAAIYSEYSNPLNIVHATIASATLANGSAIMVYSGIANITNTIIASHTIGIQNTSGAASEDYTLFSGVNTPYIGAITSGGNSITGTAGFVDASTDNYRILNTSSAVNAGTNAGISFDFDSNARPFGAGFDIGYYEAQSNPPAAAACYATADNGTTVFSSANANAVQQAVDAASANGTVKLAGYCAGVQTRAGTTQTVVISKSLTLMGGFTNTVGGWTTAYPITQPTTLDAQAGGRVIHVTFGAPATLQDFTITNGLIPSTSIGAGLFALAAMTLTRMHVVSNTIPGMNTVGDGGGAYFGASAIISGSHIVSNSAAYFGGGAYFATSAIVTNSTFRGNVATAGGGGGAHFGGASNIANVIFEGNTCLVDGCGARFNAAGAASITGTLFLSNVNSGSGNAGGAVFYGPTTLRDTAFIGNRSARGGGAAFLGSASGSAVNTRFTANSSVISGDAFHVGPSAGQVHLIHTTIASPTVSTKSAVSVEGGAVTLTNTIVASHTIGFLRNGGTVSEDYTLFNFVTTPYQGIITSGGNSITGTAAFFDTTTYTLTASSAAVDAGTNAGITSDFFGNPRPQGNGFDIGYNESPYSATSDVGISKSAAPDPVIVGATLTYTLRISNSGSFVATGVVVTDALPAGITFVSGSVITPGGSGACSATGCALGNLAAGAQATVTLVVTAPNTAGIITNTAGVSASNDSNALNNIAWVTSTIDTSCVAPSTTYVDDNWAGTPNGNDPDGAGPATNFGCDAFDTVQGGINGVLTGGSVIVAAGTYLEAQVLITKSVTVTGAGSATTILNGQNIAPPSGGLLRIEPPLGDAGTVVFSGFTVISPGTNGGRYGMFIKPLDPATVVTVTNSHIAGGNNSDYGVYIYRNRGAVVFTGNVITNTGFNGVLIEQPIGATEFSSNTITVAGPSTSYFQMTYGGENVTTTQRVAYNTINSPLASGIIFNPSTAIVGAGSRYGKYTRVEIIGNTITNLGVGRNGIGLLNDSSDLSGAAGAFDTPLVVSNTITGTGALTSTGIQLRGLSMNAVIQYNDIRNLARSIAGAIVNTHAPTGTVARYNNFVNNTRGIDWNANPTSTLLAENNWWGCNAGPGNAGCDPITGTQAGIVDFAPWIVLNVTASPGAIQPLGVATVTADLTQNSTPAPAGGTTPGMPVVYTATEGTIPSPGFIVAGTASAQFTSNSANSALVCATVDNQTLCTAVVITSAVGLVKQASAITLSPGDALTYTLTFSNAGAGTANGVVITDTLPASFTLTSVTSSTTGGASITQTSGSPNLLWVLGNLPAGGSGVITLAGTVSNSQLLIGTSITNTAGITASNDATPADNSAAASTAIIAPSVCFATPDDGTTVLSSANAQAVRDAVAAAAANGIVKIAGVCAGAITQDGTPQVVLITQTLTLIGGFTHTNWLAASDPVAYPTTLDALAGGRVIFATQPMTLSNLIVQNGNIANHGGGGLFLADAVITGTTFISNTASGTAFEEGGGGAYVKGAASVTNSRFESNVAMLDGGGLMANTTLEMTGTTFISNTAARDGGGLRSVGNASIVDSTFTANTALMAGGGVFDNALAMTNTTFTANTAGAASSSGGIAVNGVAALADVTFTLNSAGTGGAGGANFANSATLLRGAFISNTAAFAGGGAFFNDAATLTGTVFAGNIASANRGGGAYFNGVAVLSNTHFSGNSASADRGGGAYFRVGADVAGSQFVSNSASNRAGGAYFNANAVLTGTDFISNTGTARAGGVYIGGDGAMTGGLIQGNACSSACAGGGLFISGTLMLSGTQFLSNTVATGDGGGAYTSSDAAITAATFAGNRSNSTGGGLFHAGGTLTLTRSIFDANTTDGFGGGLNVANASVAQVFSSTFTGNAASSGGGIIVAGGATLSVTASTFAGNQAGAGIGELGGGIYSFGSADIANSTFAGNQANMGGALGNGGNMTVTNSTIAASTGAGIANDPDVVAPVTLLRNTLMASQTAGANCAFTTGTFTADAFNMADDASCASATQKTTAQIALQSLANNGGDTWTMALGANSAALEAGDDAVCAAAPVSSIDQRGVARPQATHCDVGAFELQWMNNTPTADAGASQTVTVGTLVTLTGVASSDPDGHAMTFGWSQVSGTPVTLDNASAISPTFTAPGITGQLVFQLVVADAFGLPGTPALVTVTVTNGEPTADAGAPQTVHVLDPVMLDGSASSDPDGQALSFGWSQVSGTPVTLSDASVASPTFTAPAITGTLVFQLIVTDSAGLASAPALVTVTVIASPITEIPPGDVAITLTTGSALLQPTSDFTATIGEGSEPITYVWDFGDGSPLFYGPVAVHVYAPGRYTATLTATNSAGTVTSTIHVFVPWRLLLSLVVQQASLPMWQLQR